MGKILYDYASMESILEKIQTTITDLETLKSQVNSLSSSNMELAVLLTKANNATNDNIDKIMDDCISGVNLAKNVMEDYINFENKTLTNSNFLNDSFNTHITYKINKGDTLYKIANKYNVSVESLIEANKDIIKDPNMIMVGTSLAIPALNVSSKSAIMTSSNAKSNKSEIVDNSKSSDGVILRKTSNSTSDNSNNNTSSSNIKDSFNSDNSSASRNVTTSVSGYKSNSSKGFNVTTNNKRYSLSQQDLEFFMAVVASEANINSKDDCLAVSSVILNRCEANNWVASHGSNPIAQIKAPGQFAGYFDGYYKKYMNGNINDNVRTAVLDALNGIRNCDYLSFRSNGSTSYSNNMIDQGGNRYK